jgi:hypothetical protein
MCLTLCLTVRLILLTNRRIKIWQTTVILPNMIKRARPVDVDTRIPKAELRMFITVSRERTVIRR